MTNHWRWDWKEKQKSFEKLELSLNLERRIAEFRYRFSFQGSYSAQPTITWSKLMIETSEKDVKCVQS